MAPRAMAKPNSSPPANSRANTWTAPRGSVPISTASGSATDRVTRMPMNRPKAAMATASFSSDSPSARIDRRFGAPTSRKIPITAAGSVVDTTAPSSRQTTISMPVARWTTPATAAMHTSTATMASSSTAEISSIRRRTSIVRPAVNNRGGRNSGRNTSVPTSSLSKPTKASPSTPSLMSLSMTHEPMKPRLMPAMASRTVCGRRNRSATGTSTLTTVSTIAIARRE